MYNKTIMQRKLSMPTLSVIQIIAQKNTLNNFTLKKGLLGANNMLRHSDKNTCIVTM